MKVKIEVAVKVNWEVKIRVKVMISDTYRVNTLDQDKRVDQGQSLDWVQGRGKYWGKVRGQGQSWCQDQDQNDEHSDD